MAFIEWDDTYSVNFAQIDQQHQRLFDMINQLHVATTRQRAQGTVTGDGQEQETIASVVRELATMADVLDELLSYVYYHFSAEENLMLARSYPDYAVHKSAHTRFSERVQTFKQDFDEGGAVSSGEIVEFLKDWLTNHILIVDKKLGRFLSEKDRS